MIFLIKLLQIGKTMSKEEAQLMLISQPLVAKWWVDSGEPADVVRARLQDPAWVESDQWLDPDQIKVSRADQISMPDEGLKIEYHEPIFDKLPHADMISVLLPEEINDQEAPKITSTMKRKKSKNLEKRKEATVQPEQSLAASDESMKPMNFYEWLQSMPVSGNVQARPVVQKTIKKPKPAKSKAAQMAEESLVLGAEIVSETLAKLLGRQGHKEEAIAMYEKLIEKYPQKGSTFAAAIEKLKL